MSAAEEVLEPDQISRARPASVVEWFLDLLSSVRLGIVLLCALVALSMVGMLIMQQEVDGFDAYFAALTPAEKLVFGRLGLFDIYHSWYYNLLLLILSLNIVLASIDRFPSAWEYIVSPKISATKEWLLSKKNHATLRVDEADASVIADVIAGALRAAGLRPHINEISNLYYGTDRDGKKDFSDIRKENILYVFGERGKWNRVGAYIVHVALLVLFMGHFVAFQTGFNADVRMTPGDKTDQIQMIRFDLDKKERFNVQVPFTLECTDIEQKLIDPEGGIDVTNTLDWRTQVRINDPQYGTNTYDVSLNKPLSYRGYRFFQAQTVPLGSARQISLQLTPESAGSPVSVAIARGGSATLDDGTVIAFSEFLPDFTIGANGKPDTRSGDYNNPAAVLNVSRPDGTRSQVIAFTPGFAEKAPVAGAAKLGYKWRLTDFERSPYAHILSIKYDPYNASFIAWYVGGFGLIGALIFVFFVSHRRVWARIEPAEDGKGHNIVIAGEANRNHASFEDKFAKLVDSIKG